MSDVMVVAGVHWLWRAYVFMDKCLKRLGLRSQINVGIGTHIADGVMYVSFIEMDGRGKNRVIVQRPFGVDHMKGLINQLQLTLDQFEGICGGGR